MTRDRAATDRSGVRTDLVAVLVLVFVPWTTVVSQNGVDFVFAWGLLALAPLHVTDLFSYLFVHTRGLPGFLLAWPVSTGLWVAAVVSAHLGLVEREDRRVTAGLLALAGLAHLRVALGLSAGGTPAVPTGTLALWFVAWWRYRDGFTGMLPGGDEQDG